MLFNDLSVKRGNLPTTVSVFPLSGALLLPAIELPLNIFEPKYMNMVDDAFAGEKLIGMIQPEQKKTSKLIKNKPLYNIGCLGKIKAFNETDDGRYLIILTGIIRFEVQEEIATTRGYRMFRVKYDDFIEDLEIKETRENFKLEIAKKDLITKIDSYLKKSEAYNGIADIQSIMDVESAFLIDFLCTYLPFTAQEKQLFIEAKTIEERTKALYKVLGMAEAELLITNLNKTMH